MRRPIFRFCAMALFVMTLACGPKASSADGTDWQKNWMNYMLLQMAYNYAHRNDASTAAVKQATNAASNLAAPMQNTQNVLSDGSTSNLGLLNFSSSNAGLGNLNWATNYQGGCLAGDSLFSAAANSWAEYQNASAVYPDKRRRNCRSGYYTNVTHFSDHSLLVNFYSNAARTRSIGYQYFDAPMWSPTATGYPVLFRTIGDFTVNGQHLHSLRAYVVNDPNGISGSLTKRITDDHGNVIWAKYTVSGSVRSQTVTYNIGKEIISETATLSSNGARAYQTSDNYGITATLNFAANGSGKYQYYYYGQLEAYVVWDQYDEGYYQVRGYYPVWFNDISDIL